LINSLDAGIEVAEVIPVSAYPKTTSGKVQRFILSNHYTNISKSIPLF
jgi:acyl-coenzyme A synthetase/AMP-(fatty) acid ligase